MLLKTWFLLLYLFSNVKSQLIYFIQVVSQHQKLPNLQIEALLEFKNAMNIEIIGFYLMHLRFALDLSQIC